MSYVYLLYTFLFYFCFSSFFFFSLFPINVSFFLSGLHQLKPRHRSVAHVGLFPWFIGCVSYAKIFLVLLFSFISIEQSFCFITIQCSIYFNFLVIHFLSLFVIVIVCMYVCSVCISAEINRISKFRS